MGFGRLLFLVTRETNQPEILNQIDNMSKYMYWLRTENISRDLLKADQI